MLVVEGENSQTNSIRFGFLFLARLRKAGDASIQDLAEYEILQHSVSKGSCYS